MYMCIIKSGSLRREIMGRERKGLIPNAASFDRGGTPAGAPTAVDFSTLIYPLSSAQLNLPRKNPFPPFHLYSARASPAPPFWGYRSCSLSPPPPTLYRILQKLFVPDLSTAYFVPLYAN